MYIGIGIQRDGLGPVPSPFPSRWPPLSDKRKPDVSGGLVGFACDEVHGYAPQSAFDLMRNIVLTKARGPAASQPAAKPAAKSTGKKAAKK